MIDNHYMRLKLNINIEDEPFAKYLHQKIIYMNHEYIELLFGNGSYNPSHEEEEDITYFEPYIKDKKAYKILHDKMEKFACSNVFLTNSDWESSTFKNVDEFDSYGKELCKELQEQVKGKFIVVYQRSWYEIMHRKKILKNKYK